MDYQSQFKEHGFFIVKDAISSDEVTRFRGLCEHYFEHYPTNVFADGCNVPGWAGDTPELEELNLFHKRSQLLELSSLILDCEQFVFTEHSDLHKNMVTLWHRDHIDYGLGQPEVGPFTGFDKKNFWKDTDPTKPPKPEDEHTAEGFWDAGHRIIKFVILLQSHKDNDQGLWVMKGSHKQGVEGVETCIHTNPRDLIVFDHRIMHRGQLRERKYHELHGRDRILLSWGFGRDNKFTHQFMHGCNKRQQFVRKQLAAERAAQYA